jgi:hypothetical protein
MAIASASYTVEWKPGASWVDITASVLEVRGGNELTGNPDNALAFGDSSDSTAAITTTASLASTAWARTPIRITFTINGVAAKAFAGIVLERQREGTTLHFSCTGYAELIRATKAYSAPFALRPVATKTTASSSEDPSSGSYSAGLINWIFWQAGGRPLEQNFNTTYQAAAKFWYSCDQAALAPLWTWAAGEDGWAECQKLAQASGGQVFQASDGTVMYRQPYGYADSAPLYTFDTSVYEAEPSEQASAAKVTTSVRCSYVQRAERPMQRIAEDSTPKIIWPGRTEVITVEPSWPITELERNGSSLTADALQMTIGAGEKAILGTHYTATVVAAAQQITITITSIAAYALQLWGYVLKGKPIMASEGGSVVVGSGTEQRSIDDNPYIQTAEHAKRLASLYLLYYATPRPLRTIKHCVYDPNRTVGEVVSLTIPEWSITAQPHLITSIQHDETGLFADYQLAYVGDLPKASDYFQIGPSYAGQNKKITY